MPKVDQLRSERTSGTSSPMMNTIIRDQIDERHPALEKLTEADTSKFMSPILSPMRTKYSINATSENENRILDAHAVPQAQFDKSILNRKLLEGFNYCQKARTVVKRDSQNTLPITENVKIVNDDLEPEPEVATLKLEAINQF